MANIRCPQKDATQTSPDAFDQVWISSLQFLSDEIPAMGMKI